ncbi:MAG: 4Fe-4S dicluster domain-containing protein, partial [Thermoplasmata archaeon]|nr:4Fe-4S dicluster domain-containing protein [Thermoplasmata archaeon]
MSKMAGVNVKTDDCIGCKICIKSCPYDAIDFDEDAKKASINDKCTVCGACIPVCPEDAIVSEIEVVTDLSAYKDVWVFVEHRDGQLA